MDPEESPKLDQNLKEFLQYYFIETLKVIALLFFDFILVMAIVVFSAALVKVIGFFGKNDVILSVAGKQIEVVGIILEISAILTVLTYLVIAIISLLSVIKLGLVRIPRGGK